MIALIALSVVVAASGPQVVGDFDGNGVPDVAAIVIRPDGSREVVVKFSDSTKEVVVTRVDQHAVLAVVSPQQVVESCKPLVGIIPECSAASLRQNRAGLAFKRVQQEMIGLSVWDGARFTTMIGTDIKLDSPPANTANQDVQPPPIPSTSQSTVTQVGTLRRTTLSLDVAASGKVEACRVVEASGSAELDAKACSIAIEKARYGTNGNGGTVKPQTRRLSITWPK